MVEFIGVLKVKVLNGTNLAVRDVLSSDPYVVLKLGKQVSRSYLPNQLNTFIHCNSSVSMVVNFSFAECPNSCGGEQLESRVE